MLKITLVITMMVSSLFGGWVSKVQYNRLIAKQHFLQVQVRKLGLPKKTVDIFLGKYLRESSIGNKTFGDKYQDKYFYINRDKKIYIKKKVYSKARYYHNRHVKYIKVKYGHKYYYKTLYVEEGDPVPITQASLGDYNITFPAILFTIRVAKLKQYYRYLSKDKQRLIHKVALANRAMNDSSFNTIISLNYFKLNYHEAIRRHMRNPLNRAISRHNGFWYNYKYIRLVKKDERYVLAAIKENRWNIK